KAAPPPMPQRPTEPIRSGKPPVIIPKSPPREAAMPEPAAPAEEAPAEQPIAATSTAVEEAPPTPPDAPRRPGPLAGAMGRERYVNPAALGRVPVVGADRPSE